MDDNLYERQIEMEDKLKWALDHSLNQGKYPDVFPLDFGMDFHLETKPELYPTLMNDPRKVKIIIDSYIGICAEAVHWYASIKADGIQITEDRFDERGNHRKYVVGGCICEEYQNLPYDKKSKWDSYYTIDAERIVTSDMIYKNPQMWEVYDPGDKTHRFDSKEDALETAKKIVNSRFPGWEVITEFI